MTQHQRDAARIIAFAERVFRYIPNAPLAKPLHGLKEAMQDPDFDLDGWIASRSPSTRERLKELLKAVRDEEIAGSDRR